MGVTLHPASIRCLERPHRRAKDATHDTGKRTESRCARQARIAAGQPPSRAGTASGNQSAGAGGVPHRIDSRRRWFPDLRELFRSGDLLVLLTRRQITVTYRQTVLGAAWIFVSPVLSAGLFTIVFGRIAHLSSGGTSYFVFSYAGLLGWNFSSPPPWTGSASSLTANSTLISKIYFFLATRSSTRARSVRRLIQLGISVGRHGRLTHCIPCRILDSPTSASGMVAPRDSCWGWVRASFLTAISVYVS